MKIIQYLKNYRKSTDILLLVFFVGNLAILGDIIFSSFNNDFVICVIEKRSDLPDLTVQKYTIEQREVYSYIRFTSAKFLDFVFVDKVKDSNLFLWLFTAFVLFQLMRIKSLWYNNYFTKKLYVNIHPGLCSGSNVYFL
ncbi:MAG: hypothetical protein V4663_14935 [Bacteroidota bacterium]